MYCNRCNAYNDDNARFCNNCGVELKVSQPQPDAYSEQNAPPMQEPPFESNVPPQNGFNSNSPYGQPMYRSQSPKYSNVLPIVSIVLSILNFNVIGIIFAFLSLSKYNSSENAMRMGDFMRADDYGRKSRTYSIISLVFSIALMILRPIIAFVCVFLMGDLAAELFDGYSDFYYDEYLMLTNAVSMLKAII